MQLGNVITATKFIIQAFQCCNWETGQACRHYRHGLHDCGVFETSVWRNSVFLKQHDVTLTANCGFGNQNLMMHVHTSHKTAILIKPGYILWRKCPLVFPLMSYDCSDSTLWFTKLHVGCLQTSKGIPEDILSVKYDLVLLKMLFYIWTCIIKFRFSKPPSLRIVLNSSRDSSCSRDCSLLPADTEVHSIGLYLCDV